MSETTVPLTEAGATPVADTARQMLRHVLATLAYRAAKVLRDAPPAFATYELAGRRQPVQLLSHLGDLMTWALYLANGEYRWRAEGSDDWNTELERFFDMMAQVDRRLAQPEPLGYPGEVIFQGPFADALTHVGQLAMLRGAFGAPVRPESYARADIVAGRVGLDQAAAGREFDGDASALPRTPAS